MFDYHRYRFKWWRAKYIVPKYPVHVDLELSSHCNLKCGFCLHSAPQLDFEKKFMAIDLYSKVVKNIAGRVPSIKLNLRGESTLHPDFSEMLKYLQFFYFIDVRLNTNGNYPTELNEVIARHCRQVIFSVDAGNPDTYRSIKGGGSLWTVHSNVNIMTTFLNKKGYRLKDITLSFVETAANSHEREGFTYWWENYPVKLFIRPAMDRKHGDRSEFKGRKNCYMANRRLVVAADGSVFPCCVAWHKPFLVVGDANNESLIDIWGNTKMQSLRNKLANIEYYDYVGSLPTACKNCDSRESYT